MITAYPEPSAAMLDRSSKLSQYIREEIHNTTSGRISFARFMELALLQPHLGYYNSDSVIFGSQGDFVTAPEISPLFSACLANYCRCIISELPEATILEIGAGTARMAADLLLRLDQYDALPTRYIIFEVSDTLRLQQQHYLQQHIPHLIDRIEHLASMPSEPIQGIILANEVVDALPVHSFVLEHNILQERYVGWQDEQFAWKLGAPSSLILAERLQLIRDTYLKNVEQYVSETRISLNVWLASLKASLLSGCIIMIDYGFLSHEYYHPQRIQGTLRCHYRHHCHDDPLRLVGLQDITSDVDFTQLAQVARQLGFQIEGFVSQAAFLLACGLLELDELCYNSSHYLTIKGQIHQLLSPNEMGELCKVLIIRHNYTRPMLSLKDYNRDALRSMR